MARGRRCRIFYRTPAPKKNFQFSSLQTNATWLLLTLSDTSRCHRSSVGCRVPSWVSACSFLVKAPPPLFSLTRQAYAGAGCDLCWGIWNPSTENRCPCSSMEALMSPWRRLLGWEVNAVTADRSTDYLFIYLYYWCGGGGRRQNSAGCRFDSRSFRLEFACCTCVCVGGWYINSEMDGWTKINGWMNDKGIDGNMDGW